MAGVDFDHSSRPLKLPSLISSPLLSSSIISRSTSRSTLIHITEGSICDSSKQDLEDLLFEQFESHSPLSYSTDSLDAWYHNPNSNQPFAKLLLSSHATANSTTTSTATQTATAPTISPPRANAPPPSLDDILAANTGHPYNFDEFVIFLSRQHCIETLEFILDVAKYADLFQQKIRDRQPYSSMAVFYQRIVKTYFESQSEKELNIPEDIKQDLRKSAYLVDSLIQDPSNHHNRETERIIRNHIHPTVFNEVTRLTKTLIRENAYLAFIAQAKQELTSPPLSSSTIQTSIITPRSNTVPRSDIRSRSLPNALISSSLDEPRSPIPFPKAPALSNNCFKPSFVPVPYGSKPSSPNIDYLAISPFADFMTPPDSPYHNNYNNNNNHNSNINNNNYYNNSNNHNNNNNHNTLNFKRVTSHLCLNGGTENNDNDNNDNNNNDNDDNDNDDNDNDDNDDDNNNNNNNKNNNNATSETTSEANFPESASSPADLDMGSSSWSESHWRRMTRRIKWKK